MEEGCGRYTHNIWLRYSRWHHYIPYLQLTNEHWLTASDVNVCFVELWLMLSRLSSMTKPKSIRTFTRWNQIIRIFFVCAVTVGFYESTTHRLAVWLFVIHVQRTQRTLEMRENARAKPNNEKCSASETWTHIKLQNQKWWMFFRCRGGGILTYTRASASASAQIKYNISPSEYVTRSHMCVNQ